MFSDYDLFISFFHILTFLAHYNLHPIFFLLFSPVFPQFSAMSNTSLSNLHHDSNREKEIFSISFPGFITFKSIHSWHLSLALVIQFVAVIYVCFARWNFPGTSREIEKWLKKNNKFSLGYFIILINLTRV